MPLPHTLRWSLLFVALALVGCSHRSSLKKTFARAHQCSAREVTMTPWGHGYLLEGCGAREVCQSARGPCGPDTEALMVRARSTWAAMRGCSEAEIQVSAVDQGIAVAGCGAYGICPGSATNCFASTPPSCQDQARDRYNMCVGGASRMGAAGRSATYYPSGAAVAATEIARGVTSTVAEARRADACQQTYELELQSCPGAPR